MGISVVMAEETAVDSVDQPGLYKSEKGSYVLRLEGSSNGRTEPQVNDDYCVVIDVDSGCSFLKKTANLKGSYKRVADLDDLMLAV